MNVSLVLHPSELAGIDIRQSSVVVFDVIRATTTIVTALANDATEVRAFAELEDARAAHADFAGSKLLAGERGCLPPPGFDLGNSPGDFTRDRVDGRTIFLSTTNGTRAIRACAAARQTFVASLCNATAMARRLIEVGDDVVLVCAGVDGAPGGEDVLGAATVAEAMKIQNPITHLAGQFAAASENHSLLHRPLSTAIEILRDSPGASNLAKANLLFDVDFCTVVDRFDVVATVTYRADFASIRVNG